MTGTITPDGQPVHWQAVYYRHHVRYEDDEDSLEDAVGALWAGSESGGLSVVGVRRPDGSFISDTELDGMLDALREQYDRDHP